MDITGNVAKATATFPWEYAAQNFGDIPVGVDEVRIYLGLGLRDVLPPDDHVFTIRIDEDLPETQATSCAHIRAPWADTLRLPVDGPNSHDHPLVRSIRRRAVTWIGSAKEFKTVYDLIVASSHWNTGNRYVLAPVEGASAEAPVIRENIYHPMCSKIPRWETLSVEEHIRVTAIMLGLILQVKRAKECGIFEKRAVILKNSYSFYSTHTSHMIMLITYFGIYMQGDGTVQDKFDRSADYRKVIHEYAEGVIKGYLRSYTTAELTSETIGTLANTLYQNMLVRTAQIV
jgi:hypothetical protein